jgi:ATP-dependent protease ClpP protease subunit
VNARRFSLVRNDGRIWLADVIDTDSVSAAALRRSLREIADQDTVNVMIDSPGGNTREALAMYVALQSCRRPVFVTVIGLAGSAAALVAMAGREIVIAEHGRFFLHSAMASLDELSSRKGRSWVYASELRDVAKAVDRDDAVAIDIFAGRTGQSRDRIKQLLDDEATLSAWEAVELGFADKIVSVEELAGRCAARSVANTNELENQWWAA